MYGLPKMQNNLPPPWPHFSHIMANVGVTFAAVVGIFAAVLLAGAYSVGAVAKQFDRLMRVMENVVDMRVEPRPRVVLCVTWV